MSNNQNKRLPFDSNFDIYDSNLNFTDLLNVQNTSVPPSYTITVQQNQEPNHIDSTPIHNNSQVPNTLLGDNIQTREALSNSQLPITQLGDNSRPQESPTISGRQETEPRLANDEEQSNNQSIEEWDNRNNFRQKLPWNRATRDFDAVAGCGKKGIAASITSIIKIKQDHEGSCWSKVSRNTKEFYFGEFKKKYKWDPRIDGEVRTAFMSKAAIRYKCLLYNARQEQKKWVAEEHHNHPYFPSWTNSSIWAAWNGYTNTPEFERKSKRGKKNRRRGDPSAEPLGTYHCGSLSAAKIMEEMAKKEGNERPNAYKIFCRTKGVSDGKGNRILVNEDDKRLDVIYNRMVDEHLQAGKTPDFNDLYLRAVLELTDRPAPPASVYGIASASQTFYPNLVDPPSLTTDDRTVLDRIRERFMRQEEQIGEIMRHITAVTVTETRVNTQQQHLDLLQQRLATVEHENAHLKNLLSRIIPFGNGAGGSSRGAPSSC